MFTPDVRIAVIGAGIMGADHARLLSSQIAGATVAHIVDYDAARAGEVAALCGATSGTDGVAAINDEAIDAVLVASPDRTHRDLVLAAVAAGKPILCEKPLAADTAECQQIIEAEQVTGRRLISVGFMRRFDPGYASLRSVVGQDDLGAPLMVHNIHRNTSTANSDTAAQIISSPVHEFDTISWLVGEPIQSVQVVSGRRTGNAKPGLVDPMLIVIRTASGVVADIEMFMNSTSGYDVRCELVCERGSVSLRPPASVERRTAYATDTLINQDWRDRFVEAYRAELQTWVDSVRLPEAGFGDLATAYDGYASIVVADACIESLRTGLPVAVALD